MIDSSNLINVIPFLMVVFEMYAMTKRDSLPVAMQCELWVLVLSLENQNIADCSTNFCLDISKSSSEWLKSHHNEIQMLRNDSKIFAEFPKESIVESRIALGRTPLINNTAEVLFTDGSGKRDTEMTDISRRLFPSFIVNYSFYHLSNTYYNSRNSFFKNGINYHVDEMTDEMKPELICRFSFPRVIGISIPLKYFGDISLGMIHRMTLVPLEAYEDSVIVCPTPPSLMWVKEVMEALGVKSSLIHVPIDEYVFAENLFTVVPDWYQEEHDAMWHSFYGEPVWIFAETLRKRFKCNDVKPFRYVLTNRAQGGERWMANLPQLRESLLKKYPDKNFEIIQTTWPSLEANVKDVVEMRWILYMTGSNAMRFVFMSPGTVAVQYMTECYEAQQFSMFTSRGVYVIAVFNRFLKHSSKRLYINIDWAMKAAERSFYTLETQSIMNVSFTTRWPEKEWRKTPKGDIFVTLPKFVNYS